MKLRALIERFWLFVNYKISRLFIHKPSPIPGLYAPGRVTVNATLLSWTATPTMSLLADFQKQTASAPVHATTIIVVHTTITPTPATATNSLPPVPSPTTGTMTKDRRRRRLPPEKGGSAYARNQPEIEPTLQDFAKCPNPCLVRNNATKTWTLLPMDGHCQIVPVHRLPGGYELDQVALGIPLRQVYGNSMWGLVARDKYTSECILCAFNERVPCRGLKPVLRTGIFGMEKDPLEPNFHPTNDLLPPEMIPGDLV